MIDSAKLNKMATKSIPRLLFSMSLPAMLSMFVMSLYNIVDSIFVAQFSQQALEAVTIAFPMQMVATAVALGIGIGTNSIVARRLGEGKKEEASQFAQTGFFLALVAGALFIIIGAVVPRFFMKGFSSNPDVINMGTNYLMICMMCTFAVAIEMTISKTLQGTGNMIVPMISQLLGAVTNIILDPIFIFAFGLGATGAGIATVIGQIVSMLFIMIMATKRSHIIQIYFKDFKLSLSKVLTILKVGAPAMVMNAVGGFITMILNGIIRGIHEAGIVVLGIYFKVQSFVFMPVFGLNQGALPIMSFSYGAIKKERFKKTLSISIVVSFIIMAIGLLLFQLFPELIMKMFNAEGDVLTIGIKALRTISIAFIPAAIGIVITTAYQAIGCGFTSLVMSLTRQIILIIPSAMILGQFFGLDYLWYCYPIAETITVSIFTPLFIVFAIRAFKKKQQLFDDLQEIKSLDAYDNDEELNNIEKV